MDVVTLARWQFALTSIYHFFFVPLTMGLSVLVAAMQTAYVITGNDVFKRMTKFWGKLFLINFALGVVTGLVQEFQFGMAWAQYSRFVGDIFGAPLAIEALLAFFLESTFIGLWVFGWEKLPKKVHLTAIWLVALGSNFSALWILIANSFMQHPVGFALNNGRAEMTDFFALLTNPYVWLQFPHTVLAALSTAGFFVLGVSAYHLWRKTDPAVFRRSFQWGAVAGLLAVLGVVGVGHRQMQNVVQNQPMKAAAAEALWETEDPAGLSLFTITDQAARRNLVDVRVPALLSFLAYDQPTGAVRGITDIETECLKEYGAGDYTPLVWLTYWTFRGMVGAGTLMIGIAAAALILLRGAWLEKFGKFLPVFSFAIALPYLANTCGWLLTETGRFPWVVFGLMKVQDAVSPTLTAGMLLMTLIGFGLTYAVLIVVDVYLLVKYARLGPAA